MSAREPRRAISRVMRTALKWSPFLLTPFGVLFCETWLQLQIFENDYQTIELGQEIDELEEEIHRLRREAADLGTMDRLEAMAPEMGLVPPERKQIVTIQIDPEHDFGPLLERQLEVAQLPLERLLPKLAENVAEMRTSSER